MLHELRERMANRAEVRSLTKRCPGLHTDSTLKVKLPQYIKCGENVHIGEGSRLLCWDSYRGERFENPPQITIGSGVRATRNLTIQCASRITIGDNVLIASDVFMVDYNHGMSPLTDSYLENPLDRSDGITIEEGVWIGNNVIILPNVTIGRKSIIGAGAVVTRSIPPYCMAVGNPARVIRKYDSERNEWVRTGDE